MKLCRHTWHLWKKWYVGGLSASLLKPFSGKSVSEYHAFTLPTTFCLHSFLVCLFSFFFLPKSLTIKFYGSGPEITFLRSRAPSGSFAGTAQREEEELLPVLPLSGSGFALPFRHLHALIYVRPPGAKNGNSSERSDGLAIAYYAIAFQSMAHNRRERSSETLHVRPFFHLTLSLCEARRVPAY